MNSIWRRYIYTPIDIDQIKLEIIFFGTRPWMNCIQMRNILFIQISSTLNDIIFQESQTYSSFYTFPKEKNIMQQFIPN